ncbi:DUF7662 domain-containing protein [Deinococcus sp.]|uniref:DUF7662 domain-containing protein n=1 Tax=Deinococcus sp. TaxID=47478 RepID=UPI003CC6A7D2
MSKKLSIQLTEDDQELFQTELKTELSVVELIRLLPLLMAARGRADTTSGPPALPSLSRRGGKYAPLAAFLRTASSPCLLSFSRIEEVLSGPLPPSARKYHPWWNDGSATHSQAKAWLEVGWRVQAVNLRDQNVTFIRREQV